MISNCRGHGPAPASELACEWCGRWYAADEGHDEIFCSSQCRAAKQADYDRSEH